MNEVSRLVSSALFYNTKKGYTWFNQLLFNGDLKQDQVRSKPFSIYSCKTLLPCFKDKVTTFPPSPPVLPTNLYQNIYECILRAVCFLLMAVLRMLTLWLRSCRRALAKSWIATEHKSVFAVAAWQANSCPPLNLFLKLTFITQPFQTDIATSSHTESLSLGTSCTCWCWYEFL